jgi:hypothetical protein
MIDASSIVAWLFVLVGILCWQPLCPCRFAENVVSGDKDERGQLISQ